MGSFVNQCHTDISHCTKLPRLLKESSKSNKGIPGAAWLSATVLPSPCC